MSLSMPRPMRYSLRMLCGREQEAGMFTHILFGDGVHWLYNIAQHVHCVCRMCSYSQLFEA